MKKPFHARYNPLTRYQLLYSSVCALTSIFVDTYAALCGWIEQLE
jgi:hypothetical protein